MNQSKINNKIASFDERARLERLSTPEIIQKSKATRHPAFKVFEVQSQAEGDGVYNCHEQVLHGYFWDDTDGLSKLAKKNSKIVEVLNLQEFDPELFYVPHLKKYDMLLAFHTMDNTQKPRWVGLPMTLYNADRGRVAYCAEDAPAVGSLISCHLDDPEGGLINVACNIVDGEHLAEAEPLLSEGKRILITYAGSSWYCTSLFRKKPATATVRKAYCKNDASSGTTLTCYLDTDDTGQEITVNFSLAQGASDLYECEPTLLDGDLIFVKKFGDDWYCTQIFNPSKVCACS